MTWQFTTKVYRQRKLPYLDIPPEISVALSEAAETEGYIAIRGSLNECEIRAGLVPRGSGAYRLFVTGELRQRTKLEVGDLVHVRLELDRNASTQEVPADLMEIFATDAAAFAAFEKLTTTQRHDMLKWLALEKKDETRLKRLEHLRAYLTTGQS